MGIRISNADKVNIWGKTKGFNIFLSHLAKSKNETSMLKYQLEKFGICAFVAHEDIEPGLEWQQEIKKALWTMDGLIAVMTVEFHNSPWTDQEIGFALCRDLPIISVDLGCTPKGFINSRQALKCNWGDAPIKIISHLIDKQKMINSYITKVKNCSSFDEGNELALVLPIIKVLNDLQVKKLVNAFNRNHQLKGSYGFNGKHPNVHGKGLAFHLNRITNKKISLSSS